MSKQKLVDPADQAAKKSESEEIEQETKSVSLDAITLDDLQAIPDNKASVPHPFEGYPNVYKVDGNGNRFNATNLVVLNPKEYVPQDPAGENQHIRQKDGTMAVVTIKTSHNRVLPDYQMGGKNVDTVFDLEIKLGDGTILSNCAIVPSPSIRAQLMFDFDPRSGKMKRNTSYLLADAKQYSRLRETFQLIINPRLKAERDAALISNETE